MSQQYYSLTQLQAMTRDDFVELFPQRRPRWRREGYLVDASALMRAIILATAQIKWPLTDNRGCREVWYNPVKPILYKAIGDRADENMLTFEAILSKMVKKGMLTYADLGIKDFRTLRETYENYDKAKCWKDILLFVEKDAAYVHLKPLQAFFNINIISGGGWSNTASIEDQLRELQKRAITEVVVFTVTDYDPFGFAIDREFVDKCEMLGLYVREHHRVGINREHATPEILDVQKYPVKPGRKLTVNGISFDSDRWLAEYGIERQYGLEIEAISGQPGGHQFLREIVAKELLQYLNETDRVNEITETTWQNAPKKAVADLMYGIDKMWTGPEEISTPPTQLPTQYLTYQGYIDQYQPLRDEMEQQTVGVDAEIETLQDDLAVLEDEKATLESPYREKLNALSHNYNLSRKILAYCLFSHYVFNREKWPRENYTMGYPNGCILEAVEKSMTLQQFIEQIDDATIISDIQAFLKEGMNNGEIKEAVDKVMNGYV